MQHQLLFKLLKVLCLGTAIHGLGWLSIEPTMAQTTAPAPASPVAPVIVPPITPTPAQPVAPAIAPTAPAQTTPPSLPVAPAVKIVSPTPSSLLDVPATAIVVQYRVGSKVDLKVNNQPVDNRLIGRTETDSKTNLITQTWYGVPLGPGKNVISVSTEGGEVVLLYTFSYP